MKVSGAQVLAVARLARLEIPAEQCERVAEQMSHVLDAFDVLSTIPLNSVMPLTAPKFASRADEVAGELTVEEVARNASHLSDTSFVVPKVLE